MWVLVDEVYGVQERDIDDFGQIHNFDEPYVSEPYLGKRYT